MCYAATTTETSTSRRVLPGQGLLADGTLVSLTADYLVEEGDVWFWTNLTEDPDAMVVYLAEPVE